MSAVLDQPATGPEPTGTRRGGSLLRAELHRFAARRFIHVLLGLAVLGWLAAVGVGLLNHGQPTEADYAAARAAMEEAIAADAEWLEQCAEDAAAAGEDVAAYCPAPDWQVEDFLTVRPFDLADNATTGAIAFAAGASVLAFLVGATWIGAEWVTRSIVALLFWVPDRLKVMGTKIGVLVLAAAGIGVAAQAAWLAMAFVLRAAVGTDGPLPAGFWSDLLAVQGRGVLLTVLIALLGFGLANLTRNTGAALGVAFVYVAVVENALRVWDPMLDRWLVIANSVALVNPGGVRIYDYSESYSGMNPPSFLLTNLHGGLVVTAFAAVVVGLGVWLFSRRDLH
ncbi:hypothetical protein [Blastococcus sp. SYSU DS1024]